MYGIKHSDVIGYNCCIVRHKTLVKLLLMTGVIGSGGDFF